MNIGQENTGSASRSQDFDLNLAPIVDCFTVLITFMLVSASFLSIGILEASPNTLGQATTSPSAPTETLRMELKIEGVAEIQVSGHSKQLIPIPAKAGTWDQALILQTLQGLKIKYPKIDVLTLSAQNEVEYLHLVHWMENLHPLFQQINLGGF